MSARGFSTCAVALLALCAAGCSGSAGPRDGGRLDGDELDGSAGCAVTIAELNGKPVSAVPELTADLDQDAAATGIQIDVTVAAPAAPDGTDVSLSVTKLTPDPAAKVAGGKAVFKGVTVAAGLTTVLIQARVAGCSNRSELSLPVKPAPECFFVDPPDGVALADQHDKTPGNDTFDYDVIVGTTNAAGGTVQLAIGGWTSAAVPVDAKDQAVIADAVLEIGDQVKLEGRLKVGSLERTCTATISVSSGIPACRVVFASPPVTTSRGRQGLGVAHDAAPDTAGMQARLEVVTTGLVDRVTIKVNGAAAASVAASAGKAELAALALPEGDVDLQAVCIETRSGNTGSSPVANLLVDSAAPTDLVDLACTTTSRRAGEVQCCFTSVPDGGTGGSGVERYELRYGTAGPVTAATWGSATLLAELPAPAAGPVCALAPKLPLAQQYHFGARALDYVHNASAVAVPAVTPVDLDLRQLLRDGPNATSAWGRRVAAADFNCDGFTDLAVGDPLDSAGRGRVSIFTGNAAGYLQQPTKSIIGTIDGANLGAAVAALHNFNADGAQCADLAVLASHGGTAQARVYVYLGQLALFQRTDVGPGTAAELVYLLGAAGPAPPAPLPGRITGIASAGDFDGDGTTDLALTYEDAGTDAAEVWILWGEAGLAAMLEGHVQPQGVRELPWVAAARVSGALASEGFGAALCGSGSLDADGAGELLVGAAGWKDGGVARGAVYVVRGAPGNDTLSLADPRILQIKGGAGNASFGAAVGVIGDMDQDGTIELAVGDPAASGTAGEVYVFNLAQAPTGTAGALRTIMGGTAGERLGSSLACAPEKGTVDLNKDGFADLLVGANGVVRQLDGGSPLPALSPASPGYVFTAPAGAAAFGATLTIARDANKDGFVDLVVGDPLFDGGRGRVVVYY